MNDINEEIKTIKYRINSEIKELIDPIYFRKAVLHRKTKNKYKIALLYVLEMEDDFSNFSACARFDNPKQIDDFFNFVKSELIDICKFAKHIQNSDAMAAHAMSGASGILGLLRGLE